MKKIYSLAFIVFLFNLSQISTASTYASSQKVDLVASPLSDTSNLPASSDYPFVTPLSSSQTQVTPENDGRWYVWALDTSPPVSCPSAKLQSIQIRANNTLDQEGNPDWAAVGIGYTGTSGFGMVTPDSPTITGYTTNGFPFVGRWSIGADLNGQVEPAAAIGIAGQMADNWDVSTLTGVTQFYISVGHDAEDGTQGLQTTLQSIVATFDTSSCDQTLAPLVPLTGSQGTSFILLAISGILILSLLTHFKQKYL